MSPIIDKLKQYPVAIVGAAVLFLCLVVAFLRGDVVDELSAQEGELIARIRTIGDNVKNSKNLEQDLESLDAYVASIDERLFDAEERSVNTNFFYSLEDKLDVVISNVNQRATESPALTKGGPNALALYSGVIYEISVRGTFKEILGFMYEVQDLDSLMRIASVEVREGTAPEILSAELSVIVLGEKR